MICRAERVVVGECRRCGEDAHYYPTIICDDCHKEFVMLNTFEAGSKERRKAVEQFYAGEEIFEILKEELK